MNFRACVTEQVNELWDLLQRTSLPFSCSGCSRVAVSKQAGVPVDTAQIRCYHPDRDESACAVEWGVGWLLAGGNQSLIWYLSLGRFLMGTRCTLGRAESSHMLELVLVGDVCMSSAPASFIQSPSYMPLLQGRP